MAGGIGTSCGGDAETNINDVGTILQGLLASLLASLIDALGLNLMKRDHLMNDAKPRLFQKAEFLRPWWCLGLGLYILSQVGGSSVAVALLPTSWVAPLGAMALVFNFMFARMLVGTQIVRNDIIGTLIVFASVIAFAMFSQMKGTGDPEKDGEEDVCDGDQVDINKLLAKYLEPTFIAYFSVMDVIAVGVFFFLIYLKRMLHTAPPTQALLVMQRRKNVGLGFAVVGGFIASQTLLLASTGMSLVTLTLSGELRSESAFPIVLGFGLVTTSVLQLYSLNSGLQLADSVLVMPSFYASFVGLGLINTLIYTKDYDKYVPAVMFALFASMGILVFGVSLLASKKSTNESKGVARINGEVEGKLFGSWIGLNGEEKATE